MPKLRMHNLAISLDGCAAGPDQSLDNPLGVGGIGLHEWVFATRAVSVEFVASPAAAHVRLAGMCPC